MLSTCCFYGNRQIIVVECPRKKTARPVLPSGCKRSSWRSDPNYQYRRSQLNFSVYIVRLKRLTERRKGRSCQVTFEGPRTPTPARTLPQAFRAKCRTSFSTACSCPRGARRCTKSSSVSSSELEARACAHKSGGGGRYSETLKTTDTECRSSSELFREPFSHWGGLVWFCAGSMDGGSVGRA